MGKYGTNLEGFGAFEGGVNADKGAPLISTSSDGATALLFGPAALREIQAGVANGDFAIPPDAAGDTITEENPLPYWTFTDTDSAGAITCAIVADSTTGSGNKLRWTVAAGTTTGKTATLSRYVAIPATSDRSYSSYLEVAAKYGGSATSRNLILKLQFYTSALVATGTAVTRTYAFSSFSTSAVRTAVFLRADGDQNLIAPADAAYAKIELAVDTTGTNASESTLDIFEVKLLTGVPMLMVVPRTGSDAPASIWKDGQRLTIAAETPTTWTNGALTTTQAYLAVTPTQITLGNYPAVAKSDFTVDGTTTLTGLLTASAGAAVTGDITATGDIGFDGVIYGSSALTGPNINLGGTNARLWLHSSPAADVAASTSQTVSGVLLTKTTAGQPSTNINGTATTDAFADALRNGGIALDTTNNRGYFYANGWKFAALTTPSDSRLKEEITAITGALDTLRQLVPVAFKWKAPEAHGRTDAVADDGKRLGFIADQVATTDLAHWVETLGVDEREAHLVDTTEVLAVNIPQNEMEALVVQALLDIDTRLKALESR